MLGNRPMHEWIERYERSHTHPVNRACHMVGIPMIAASLLVAPFALLDRRALKAAGVLFGAGWALQFTGHAFERKPPEFFHDRRFLLVGLRWWAATVGLRRVED